MCFGAAEAEFTAPWPPMTADNVCFVGRVVTVGLDFLYALAVSFATMMELTALLVIRVPARIEILGGVNFFALLYRLTALFHCATEPACNVFRILCIKPARL